MMHRNAIPEDDTVTHPSSILLSGAGTWPYWITTTDACTQTLSDKCDGAVDNQAWPFSNPLKSKWRKRTCQLAVEMRVNLLAETGRGTAAKPLDPQKPRQSGSWLSDTKTG